MKLFRTFLLLFSLLTYSMSFAQSEELRLMKPSELKSQLKPNQSVANGWLVTQRKGDELLGMKDYVHYFWIDGQFTVDLIPDQQLVGCGIRNGIFDLSGNKIIGIIGLYDRDRNLVEKYTDNFYGNDSYDYVHLLNVPSNKIIEYIKTKSGFVRFVIGTYGSDETYDITVRCLNN